MLTLAVMELFVWPLTLTLTQLGMVRQEGAAGLPVSITTKLLRLLLSVHQVFVWLCVFVYL